MLRYAFNPANDKLVRVYGRGLSVSNRNSIKICRAITGKPLPKAKSFVERMVSGKGDLDGKYYTNASKEILNLLKSAEDNAEFRGLDAKRMIVNASAHKGFAYYRPRRFKMKRQTKKVTHIQIVCQEK